MRSHITFRFHDNDFTTAQHVALEVMRDQYPDILCKGELADIKEMIIRLMVGVCLAQHWKWGGSYRERSMVDDAEHYYEYFSRSSVSDTKEDAMQEHNSEWGSVDLNLGTVWVH
jgi:hypothetical protein